MSPQTSTAKDRLLRSFPELIRASSLSAITLDRICEAAKVHRGSFYHAFSDKQAWADASLEAMWDASREQLDNCFSPRKSPSQRLEDYLDLMNVNQCGSTGCISGCPFFSFGVALGHREPELRSKIQEILVEYRRYLETMIRDGQADGSFREGSVDELTTAAFHAVEGALSHGRILQSPQPVQDLKRTLHLLLTP